MSRERFYGATSLRADVPVDLLDTDQCSESLKRVVEQEGVELRRLPSTLLGIFNP
jgi:hydroxyacyl-ACP dehydratase HTD2-like protein with hotdog domain